MKTPKLVEPPHKQIEKYLTMRGFKDITFKTGDYTIKQKTYKDKYKYVNYTVIGVGIKRESHYLLQDIKRGTV